MRLLRPEANGEFSLVEFDGKNIPDYAILSHTWGADQEEVTFKDLVDDVGKSKSGYSKIRFCGKQAAKNGLQFFWVDTCCIDKSSSAELSEAINSMFRWYQNAARCYVYLSDVSVSGPVGDDRFSRRWKPAFKRSRWFTRGWTLQELIAPALVEFFSKEGQQLGDKQSLEQTLHEITGITIQALRGSPLSHFSMDERMSWAAKRKTKREEDEVYSLLGIFDICMPLLYGEGRKRAGVRLRKEIEEFLKEKEEPKEIKESLGEKEKQKEMLLKSLRFNQIDARFMTIKNANAKTCEWLLKKSEYVDWFDATKLGEHHGLMWIKGKPGAGKSTLMKFALTHAHQTMKGWTVISFFFNARGEDIEKSTTGTYQSLLYQLLKELPVLQDVLDSPGLLTSSISTNHQWSVESLKSLLQQAIQRLGKSSVVCFIDALDECEESQIRDMLSFFEQVGELAVEAGIRFRVCFSSRHYPHITIGKGLDLVLEGQKGHDQDITNYLDSELKIGDSEVAKQIQIELQEKASGVFMWVVLVVRILNKEYDRGRIHALRQRIQEIPGDLHELFRDILTRDPNNRDELVLCIQWVLFARQPLSPDQLYFAVLSGAEPDALSRWDLDVVTADIKRLILDYSKGLAEITTSLTPKVQFIHESVRDFLLEENALGSIWPNLGSNFQGQSHERLKNCCLNYMGIDVFTRDLPKASSQKATDFGQSTTSALLFLKYAVRNVLYHADVAAGCSIAQENFLQSFPLDRWIRLHNQFEDEVRMHTQNVSLLYVLAEGNKPNLIRAHPSPLSCLEVENERYGPPLFAALATGSKEAVRTFVEVHAATQSPESCFHILYSRYRHNECSQSKFAHNFKFSNQRTTLSYLAELGDEVIFAFGLERGNIVPDSKDQDGRTPLCWAAANGRKAVVKLLFDTDKVDVNSKDRYGRTPLSWGAENGDEETVQLLLGKDGVDVNSKDFYGRTALSYVAGYKLAPLSKGVEKRLEAVVRLLLGKDEADVDSKDKAYGRTPLWYAAANRHEAVVRLLLDQDGVDVNSKDRYGRTPLSWAAGNWDEEMVQLLLGKDGVDVNSKDRYGRTPLSWARGNGDEGMVKLLQLRNASS